MFADEEDRPGLGNLGNAMLVGGLTDTDLDAVIDENWNPPVTLDVRLVSFLSDGLQHVGQAAFVRGIAQRR